MSTMTEPRTTTAKKINQTKANWLKSIKWYWMTWRKERKEKKEKKTLNYSLNLYTCFGFSTNFVSRNKHQTNNTKKWKKTQHTHLNLMTINLRYIFKHYSIVQFYFSTAILEQTKKQIKCETKTKKPNKRQKWKHEESASNHRWEPINESTRKIIAN